MGPTGKRVHQKVRQFQSDIFRPSPPCYTFFCNFSYKLLHYVIEKLRDEIPFCILEWIRT